MLPDAEQLAGQTCTSPSSCCGTHPGAGRSPTGTPTAVVQPHCHQHAIMGVNPDTGLLRRAGIVADVLDHGCCRLAGNFDFENGHYDVSMARADRVLLPAVRDASPATLIIADDFGCRTQIAHRDRAQRDASRGVAALGAARRPWVVKPGLRCHRVAAETRASAQMRRLDARRAAVAAAATTQPRAERSTSSRCPLFACTASAKIMMHGAPSPRNGAYPAQADAKH